MRGTLKALTAAFVFWGAVAQAEPVKIVNIGHPYYSAGLFIAQREGFFKKYGLEPEVSEVGGGPLALQAVLTGSADVGILSYEHVLTAAVQGRQMVSIFNLVNRPSSNIIANKALIEAAKGKDLQTKIKMMKGMRIGVPSAGGSGDKITRAMLEGVGFKANDVSMIYNGASTGSYVAALQRNLIDVAVVPEPAGLIIRESGFGDIYLNLLAGEVPAFDDMLYMTLTTTPKLIKERPDFLKKVVAAFAEAQRFIKEHPEKAMADMNAEYPNLTPQMNRELFEMENGAWSKDGHMTLKQAQATQAYLQAKGDKPLVYEDTFSNVFLTK
jgi:NitT/TauT family transport system substrate-binding protein